MHSPLSSFLVGLVQSHGCGVKDVSITNDTARCMLPPRFCLSNREEDHSACDTEEQNGPRLKSPASPPSFDMALAESVVVEINNKVSRWESVTSAGIAARPPTKKYAELRRRSSGTSTVTGHRGHSRRPSTSIPKNRRKTSADSTLSLPERKESLDNFSCHNVRESPKPNASFDKLKSACLQRPKNQAKTASAALARAILFDQL
jgi:hypothetical protein